MPHISIVIPTYNRAHLLVETLDSLTSQVDFDDYEITVVDDHSTDNTVDVLQKYQVQHPQVQFVVNERNLGLTRNWNKCLNIAKGPLVQLMQSDDLIDPGYLTRVSAMFDRYPNLGMVAASCRHIGAHGNVISPGRSRAPAHYKAGDDAVIALLTGGYPHVSSIVLRRECYEQVGKYDERIWHGPDMEFDVRVASQYDFYHFGNVYSSFRRHGTNMGNLEYLRKDFLDVDYLKRRLTWGYLANEGLQKLGITNLDSYVKKQVARSATNGAIVTLAYGRADLSRFYVLQAIKHDASIIRNKRFWKSVILNLAPLLAKTMLKRRLQIEQRDIQDSQQVENTLYSLKDA